MFREMQEPRRLLPQSRRPIRRRSAAVRGIFQNPNRRAPAEQPGARREGSLVISRQFHCFTRRTFSPFASTFSGVSLPDLLAADMPQVAAALSVAAIVSAQERLARSASPLLRKGDRLVHPFSG